MKLNYNIFDKRIDSTEAVAIVIWFDNISAKSYDKICSIFSIDNEYIGDDLTFETKFNALIKSVSKESDERHYIPQNNILWLDENSFEQVLCIGIVYDGNKDYHVTQFIKRIEKYLLENLDNK